jgi:hypothetical protein
MQLDYSWLILDSMYDLKWESSFNVTYNRKFLVFMYFDWKARGLFSPFVFGKFWQTFFLCFSTSMVVWIGLSLLGGVFWWVFWTCCLMEVLWLGSSLLQYEQKPFNVQDESFVDFYLLHNDEYMFCNVRLTSCVLILILNPYPRSHCPLFFKSFLMSFIILR